MPSLQVVDTTRDKPEPTSVEQFFSKLGKDYREKADQAEVTNLLNKYQQNRQDANAWEDLQLGLEKSNISPTKRLQTQASLNDMRKVITERDKSLNAQVKKGMLSVEDRERQKGNLLNAGWPDYAAEIYLDAPPGVKSTMEREHKELVDRKIRSPLSEATSSDNSTAASELPGQESSTSPIPESTTEKEWPDLPKPPDMTNAERIKWENNNEKDNNKELKLTTDKKKVYRANDNLINSMTQVNDGKYLPDNISKMLIIDPETGDIRPTAQLLKLQNPQTELYVKNLKQWLKGAKEFFGARVTNFDVTSFMAQLPSLLNSEQGRRLILKQMKYVNDLESVHNNTLNEGLKNYGRNANYSQILSETDKKVASSEEELMGKINNLVGASKDIQLMAENPEKFKGMVLMQTPKGEFRSVPKDKVESLKKKKWRDF